MEVRRVKLTVAYDGTAYHGWQIQNNGNTIEAELNKAIAQITGEEVQVIGASRTDAGVHALCNVAVFDTTSRIPGEKFCYALNQRLPEDIRVVASEDVAADYHPRHMESRKTYEYKILNASIPVPIGSQYCHFTYLKLDVEEMKKAAAYLVGEHDFKSFCSPMAQVESTVRTVYAVEIEEEAAKGTDGRMLTIRVSGNGFLYNMVRIIAGTLLEVGAGRMSAEQIPDILKAMDRSAAGPTAPAKGLTLVKYEFLQ